MKYLFFCSFPGIVRGKVNTLSFHPASLQGKARYAVGVTGLQTREKNSASFAAGFSRPLRHYYHDFREGGKAFLKKKSFIISRECIIHALYIIYYYINYLKRKLAELF